MAGGAGSPQSPEFHGRPALSLAQVTARTGDGAVGSLERERGLAVVVEAHPLPRGGLVARGAVRAAGLAEAGRELATVRVLVAGAARGRPRGQGRHAALRGMAATARCLGVRAHQREPGPRVVEADRGPGHGRVAALARAKAGGAAAVRVAVALGA